MSKPLKILQASAGSGKTFSLTVHYLVLLFANETAYREILAVTFTNKATAEMKSRMLNVLKGLALGIEDDEIEAYRLLILKEYPDWSKVQLQDKADKIYRRILHDYSHFAVSTIDGFVQKVVRSFAFELGLASDYAIELNIDKVKADLLERLELSLDEKPQLIKWIIQLALDKIRDNKSWNYKHELNELLGEIFKDTYDDFDWAVRQFEPNEIEEVFANSAINLKKEIRTFENEFRLICQELLQLLGDFHIDKASFKGQSRSPLFKISNLPLINKDIADDIAKLKEFALQEEEAWFKDGKIIVGFYQAILTKLNVVFEYFGNKYSNYVLNKEVSKNFFYLRLMLEVSEFLAEYRQDTGKILLSDAQKLINGITNPVDENGLAIEDENPSFIWEKIGNKFSHFLIDEFQDTSHKQWKNFKSILSNAIASSNSNYYDHLIVGDTKQSIYRWRNGDWNILHRQVEEDIGSFNIENDYLSENYRSSTNIIDFNNHLYKEMAQLMQNDLDCLVQNNADTINEWWFENHLGTIPSVYQQVAQNYSPFTKKGGIIKVQHSVKPKKDSEEEEKNIDEAYSFKEDAIQRMIAEIKNLNREDLNYQWKDIGILVRTKDESSLIVRTLLEEGIPVLSAESLLLSNSTIIKLIIDTLKLITTIESQNELYKANCIAYFHRLQNKKVPVEAYFNLKYKRLSELKGFLPASLCDNWELWLQLPLVDLVDKLFVAFEVTKSTQHLPYILAFRDLLSLATENGEKGIWSFLTWWNEEGKEKTLPAPEETDAVQVMTIHKSKGLAFRAVFIPFCNWRTSTKSNANFWVSAKDTAFESFGSIPLKFVKTLDSTPLEIRKSFFKELLDSSLDALNMLYVATTRAKDYLFICLEEQKSGKCTEIGEYIANAIAVFNGEEVTNDEDKTPTRGYEIEEPIVVKNKIKNEESSLLVINEYPSSNRIITLYKETDTGKISFQLSREQAAREGAIKHQVLANTNNATEVKHYLTQLLMEGIVEQSEIENLEKEIVAVLSYPPLKAILNESNFSYTEKSIVTKEGNTERPDRIIFTDKGPVLIDYKFTMAKENKHIEQLTGYKNLIQEMGFSSVEAYLYYANLQELTKV